MGRGRAPCCEKVGLKKGPWTPAEDMRLIAYIHKYGHENWRALPKRAGLLRCGKSCRLRWINYLRPDVKRGNFTPEEEETIINLHELLGNKWSKIASRLPGRTDNEIKNVWNTHLKKRSASKESNQSANTSKESSITSSTNSSTSCCDHEQGMAEQVHKEFDSKSPPKVCEILPGEKKQEFTQEMIEIPVEPNLWDILDDDPTHLQGTHGSNLKSMMDSHLSKRLVSNGCNLPEELTSSFSSSSTCSSLPFSIAFDGNRVEEAETLFQSGRLHEVNDREHEDMKRDQLDSNMDFWSATDDDDKCFLPSSSVGSLGDQQQTISEESRQFDGQMWITYLENELGLWAADSHHHQSLIESSVEPLMPCPTYDVKLDTEIEVDPVIAYFQMHPSSPPIFSL